MKQGETMPNAFRIVSAASTRERLIQLLTFTVGGEGFAVDAAAVREIMRLPEIACLPNSPGYLDGIISLRGSLIPVISLRERFALSGAVNNSRSRVILLDVADKVAGFRVDAVSEVIHIRSGEVQPPPALLVPEIGKEAVAGVIYSRDRMLVVLAPDRMLSGTEPGWYVAAA